VLNHEHGITLIDQPLNHIHQVMHHQQSGGVRRV
jgi:hypothetical protein